MAILTVIVLLLLAIKDFLGVVIGSLTYLFFMIVLAIFSAAFTWREYLGGNAGIGRRRRKCFLRFKPHRLELAGRPAERDREQGDHQRLRGDHDQQLVTT